MNDATISRRNALRTTTLSALGVGLMAAAGAPAHVTTAPVPPLSATIGLVDPVVPPDAEWFAAWKRQYEERYAAFTEAYEAVKERLDAEGRELLMRMDGLHGNLLDHDFDLQIERICAHLPGLAPALRVTFRHVIEHGGYDHGMDCCQTMSDVWD